jgi:hypothetical protein
LYGQSCARSKRTVRAKAIDLTSARSGELTRSRRLKPRARDFSNEDGDEELLL